MEGIIGSTVGAVVGATIAAFLQKYSERRRKQQSRSHAATVLYYELLWMQKYFAEERSSIRFNYTKEWKQLIFACDFLKEKEVEYLYKLDMLIVQFVIDMDNGLDKNTSVAYKSLWELFGKVCEEYNQYKNILMLLRQYIG